MGSLKPQIVRHKRERKSNRVGVETWNAPLGTSKIAQIEAHFNSFQSAAFRPRVRYVASISTFWLFLIINERGFGQD
jgi:hypothetical protein